MTAPVLPIMDIFKEAISLPIQNFKVLLKLSIPPLAIATIILVVTFNNDSDQLEGGQFALLLLGVLAGGIALATAVVGAHRTYLLSDDEYHKTKLFYWNGNEFKYAGWWILIAFLSSILIMPLAFGVLGLQASSDEATSTNALFEVLLIIASIPIYYLTSRWAMVLPASATDNHGKTLNWSWGITKENGWRLTVLLGLFPFTMEILFSLLPEYDSIFYSIFMMISWGAVFCIELALLSLCYAFFENNKVTED